MSTKDKLYYNPICPFVQRSWITALEKGADFELVFIGLGPEKPAWYEETINPAGTLPCLVKANGEKVFESAYIAQYFDEANGIPGSLQPGDAAAKYRARKFTEQSDGCIGPMYGLLKSPLGEDADKLKVTLTQKLQALDKALAEASPSGPYFFGTNFTYADISIVPFFLRFQHTLKAYHNFDIFDGAPHLLRMTREAEGRGSVSASSIPGARWIAAYRGYAKHDVLSTYAKKLYVDRGAFSKTLQIGVAVKNLTNDVEVIVVEGNEKGPHGELPAFDAAPGLVITGSMPILQYLDEQFREGQDAKKGVLFPEADPQAAHDTRFLANTFRGDLGELIFGFLDGEVADKDKEERKGWLLGMLKNLNATLEKRGPGPFFLGDKVTFADVANLPLLAAAVEAVAKASPDTDFAATYPRLAAWLAAGKKEAAFQAHL